MLHSPAKEQRGQKDNKRFENPLSLSPLKWHAQCTCPQKQIFQPGECTLFFFPRAFSDTFYRLSLAVSIQLLEDKMNFFRVTSA